MKIESPDAGLIRFDLTTPEGRRGNGAALITTDDPDTRVMYGVLHIRVSLLGLGIEVVMDQYGQAEDWQDAKYARAEALKAVRDGLTIENLQTLLTVAENRGIHIGAESARKRMRIAMGL